MRGGRAGLACCWRCAGCGTAALTARRQARKAAVFLRAGSAGRIAGALAGAAEGGRATGTSPAGDGGPPAPLAERARVVAGTVLDITPQVRASTLKLVRFLRHRSVADEAIAMFPARMRVPATLALCAAELLLGLGLLATAGPDGDHNRAGAVRLAVAVFFLVGMCALVELRERRPGAGCGCFGELSAQPPGVRSVLRAGLLASAALAGVSAPPLHLPPPGPRAVTELGLLPPARALTALRRSRQWRRHARVITSGPADMWRELCWWYVVYPARGGGQDGEVIFAVEVRPRRPAILAAVAWQAGDPAGSAPGQPRKPFRSCAGTASRP